ncbi:hypothetical protein DERF_000511 [Dermatophagoides farinae]|uniref:Uncharacterized protein n=1 Tax=Dermatophagoides farinae TaxID=6954 RepID=A0A922ICZ5_DERFA|nr:hypothetical protein DERF_000511 [Dermatophagoides farinae]
MTISTSTICSHFKCRIWNAASETSSSIGFFAWPLLTFTFSGGGMAYSSIKRHLGVTISLYCNRSTRVVAAILYGMTILFISNACCSLRRRRFICVIDDEYDVFVGVDTEPTLASDGDGEGTGESARELQPLDKRSR